MKKIFIGLIFLGLIFPTVALARIGVGVGTGKIQVDEKLKPGMIYELPSLTVLNTGDEPSDYEVTVEYHEKQPELRPRKEWFIFSPAKFYLKPGEIKTVDIKLNLPVSMEPGNYFAYLEGHPFKKAESGGTSVGVAAAAKLYFTVVPANAVLGVYYKAASFWKVYSPWTERAIWVVVIVVLAILFKKFFHLEINFKQAKKSSGFKKLETLEKLKLDKDEDE